MDVKASEAASGRWSAYWLGAFADMEVVLDKTYNNYQGHVWVLLRNLYGWNRLPKYYLIDYPYGSCSGCDSWEGESPVKIMREMADTIKSFDTKAAVLAYFEDEANDNIPYCTGEREAFLVELKEALKKVNDDE